MATAAVLQRPVFGVSTKGLQFDDPIAKLIQDEFVDRVVDPKRMMLYLPYDLLTESDEDRVATVQDNYGREAAAQLLLSLITQRDNWIPRLQQGLRYREVRLGDLADKIDKLQAQVPMQVDLADDDDTPMEVDLEPFTPPYDMKPPLKDLLGESQPKDLDAKKLKAYVDFVRAEIAQRFFVEHFARSVEEVERLTYCFEQITATMTEQFAIGCLELRLAVATSDELKKLVRLLESGVLRESLEHVLLTQKRRDWLAAQAASFGLKWQQVRVKITVQECDLLRCETHLRLQEEKASPKSLAKAFLLRTAAKTGGNVSAADVCEIPNLLLSFIDWLLKEYPDLADKIATLLVKTSLRIALPEIMYTCRQYFGLSNEYEGDVAKVLFEMLTDKDTEEIYDDAHSSYIPLGKPSRQALAEEETRSRLTAYTGLFIETEPGTPLAATVEKLKQAKLMKPFDAPGTKNAFIFSTSFVADYAFSCVADFASRHLPSLSYFPLHHVSEALGKGSSFTVLHFLDLILSPTLLEAPSLSHSTQRLDRRFTRNISKRAKRIEEVTIIIFNLSKELVQLTSDDDLPVAVVEMLMGCYKLFPSKIDISPVFKRNWITFGPEWKKMAHDLLASGTLPEIRLCHLNPREEQVLLECADQVLSFKHIIDLSGKLAVTGVEAFKAILACAQLSDVGKFELFVTGSLVKLKHIPKSEGDIKSGEPTSGQPALKLCHNTIDDMHAKVLVNALPGLQSLPQLDLTGCTLSQKNLQYILDHLPVKSMKTLIINRITFSDAGSRKFVPKFSHLKHLQILDLGYLILQDEQMSEVAQQLIALYDLRELTLEHNPITTAGLSVLTPALASLWSLRVLRLAYCLLDAGSAFVLGAMLASCHSLQVLNLSNCCLQDSGLQHLSLTMKNHTQLTKVSFRNGDYSPQGLASFLTHLAKCSHMQHLEIGQNPLEADGYDVSEKLIKTLAGSSQWDFLGLWNCRVGHTNFLQNILTLGTQLRGLTKLVLQDNNLDQASIEHLAQAIQQGKFRYLHHINLRQNSIQSRGAECLAEALPYLPRLKELLLQNSAIPSSAALSLALVSLRLPDMKLLELIDSVAMDPQDCVDVISKIRRIVQEGSAVVGAGVKYAENDQLLECRFALENIRRFSPLETELSASVEMKEERPHIKQIEEHLQLLEKGEQLKPSDEEEGAKMTEAPVLRQIAESKRNGVVIDGVLHITVGHT